MINDIEYFYSHKISPWRIFTLILFIFTLLLIILLMYTQLSNKLPYYEVSDTTFDYEYKPDIVCTKTKETMRTELANLLNIHTYLYEERDLPKNCLGETRIILRLCRIDKCININRYALTFTHELLHLKYMTVNERFTQFQTFKHLYESGDEYYKQIALNYAYEDIHTITSLKNDYLCGFYIQAYIKGEM